MSSYTTASRNILDKVDFSKDIYQKNQLLKELFLFVFSKYSIWEYCPLKFSIYTYEFLLDLTL